MNPFEWYFNDVKKDVTQFIDNSKTMPNPIKLWIDDIKRDCQQFWDNSNDQLFDVLIVGCMVGIVISIAGFKKWGSRLTLGSMIAALLFRVVLK